MGHAQRQHAILSASSSHRWLNCPPSARLEDKQSQASGAEAPSVHAEEGTLAHEIAELRLEHELGNIAESTYVKKLREFKKHPRYYDGMEDDLDGYVELVVNSYKNILEEDDAAAVYLEERIDYSHIAPEGFGTGDAAIMGAGVLKIVDLKFGRGVEVSAEKNSQLALYALGLFESYDLVFDFETIELTIAQTRLDNYSTYSLTRDELLSWGEVIKKVAQVAYKGEGKQLAGTWCKFCKVSALCNTLHKHNLALAKEEFKDASLISEERLLEIYKQVPILVSWAKDIEEYIKKRALEGKDWRGYKIVEGRSTRSWADEQALKRKLKELGHTPSQYEDKKLKSVAQMEKSLGKSYVSDNLYTLITRPQGAPTLAPEDDPRPRLNPNDSARADFQ